MGKGEPELGAWRNGGRGNCGKDVLYEKKEKKKKNNADDLYPKFPT